MLYHGLGTHDTHAVINNPRWGMGRLDLRDARLQLEPRCDERRRLEALREHRLAAWCGLSRMAPRSSNTPRRAAIPGASQITWDNASCGRSRRAAIFSCKRSCPRVPARARQSRRHREFQDRHEKPTRRYPLMTWEQQAYRQIDFVGSFTAAAGCAIYDGGTWPAEWNGSYFCHRAHDQYRPPFASSRRMA